VFDFFVGLNRIKTGLFTGRQSITLGVPGCAGLIVTKRAALVFSRINHASGNGFFTALHDGLFLIVRTGTVARLAGNPVDNSHGFTFQFFSKKVGGRMALQAFSAALRILNTQLSTRRDVCFIGIGSNR
jgi:hypothetical protein